jgi:hypothetical protein
VADQRQSNQPAVGCEPFRDLAVAHREVAETGVAVGLRGLVEQRPRPEPFREAAQLARGDGSLLEVGVVDDDAPLAKESQGSPRRRRVVAAEHLDVRHLLRRGLAEGSGHGR